jgi:hypothetical protein
MNAIKTLLLTCVCLTVLAWRVIGQSPNAEPPTAASPVTTMSPAAAVSPTPTPAAESELEKSIRKKAKKHFGITINGNDDKIDRAIERHLEHNDEIPRAVFPIVAIVMLTVFGAPVAIVAVILYFSMSRSRALHRTVRMMVEKGQPVPEALLNPPPAQRRRSDMRRGVILTMVGLGVMLWLGAVNDWEGGIWSLGLIPFLIGLGYLLVWKLEHKKEVPPPLPPA